MRSVCCERQCVKLMLRDSVCVMMHQRLIVTLQTTVTDSDKMAHTYLKRDVHNIADMISYFEV